MLVLDVLITPQPATKTSHRTGASEYRLPIADLLDGLEDRSNPLPDADAHRRQPVARITPPHLVKQRRRQPCPGRAERMADRDRPAVHVRLHRIQAEIAHDRDRLRREGLVEFDEVEI